MCCWPCLQLLVGGPLAALQPASLPHSLALPSPACSPARPRAPHPQACLRTRSSAAGWRPECMCGCRGTWRIAGPLPAGRPARRLWRTVQWLCAPSPTMMRQAQAAGWLGGWLGGWVAGWLAGGRGRSLQAPVPAPPGHLHRPAGTHLPRLHDSPAHIATPPPCARGPAARSGLLLPPLLPCRSPVLLAAPPLTPGPAAPPPRLPAAHFPPPAGHPAARLPQGTLPRCRGAP